MSRAERRAEARYHRRLHGAWRTAVHREAERSWRCWLASGDVWRVRPRHRRRRLRLTKWMIEAGLAQGSLPPRPHFQTLSAWMRQ